MNPPYSIRHEGLQTDVSTQALIIGIAASVVLQLIYQIVSYPDVWAGDFRFWTSVLTIASLGVIFIIQWLEHSRLRNPNGVVLFYWLFLLIAWSVKLRSLISQQIYVEHLPYFIAYCVGFGLSWVEFGLEWLVPKKKSAYDVLGDEDECPIEYATVFSILTFSWMMPMMREGYKKFLNINCGKLRYEFLKNNFTKKFNLNKNIISF